MKRVSATQAWTGIADCRNCGIRRSVLFAGLEEADFEDLHRPIDQIDYPAGSLIYAQEEGARSIYTIRSGLVKLTQFRQDGTQRIVRLLTRTDVLGLEALVAPSYEHDATALQHTEVCRIPIEVVRELSSKRPAMYTELMNRWHKALSDADRWITDFGTGTSRERVARLLIWLAEHYDGERCELFGREDLGALLGLTTETVSRVMADLKRRGLVKEPKSNQLTCDIDGLRAIAN
jgi:CRP-like cAMP-binding protein